MKIDTEYFYEFVNTGRPEDRVKGKGNYVDVCKAQLLWLKSISLHNTIRITISRTNRDNAEDELAALFDSILHGDESDESEESESAESAKS